MARERSKRESVSKLEEFPEDFCDVYFHNETAESVIKLQILRSIVYKRIKKEVQTRISEYPEDTPLADIFTIEFELGNFNVFSWAVIREELLYRGIESSFEFDDKEIPTKFIISMERKISLKEKPETEEENNCQKCCCNCNEPPPLVKQE